MIRVLGVFLLMMAAIPALGQASLAALEGKVVTQRRFVAGSDISYSEQGSASNGTTCSWPVCARILIRKASRHGDRIELEGERQYFVYDDKEKRFWEVMEILNGPRELRERFFGRKVNEDRIKEVRKGRQVRITIQRSGEWMEPAISDALDRIFLTPGESLLEVAGPEWQLALCKMQEYSASPICSARLPDASLPSGVFKAGGDVTRPRARMAPDPEYSEVARQLNFNGTIITQVTVNPEGKVAKVEILKPAGLGLDDKGLEAISQWVFKPATRNGEPVAVLINVEMSFRLY